MNDRHPSEDPYPPTPDADYAPYGSYDSQGVPYGNGSHTGYDGYDAYATGGVATSTASFTADGGYATDPLTTGGYATGGYEAGGQYGEFATGSFTPGAFAGASDYESDPLFGDLPGSTPSQDGYATGSAYDTGQWSDASAAMGAAHGSPGYDPYGTQQHQGYDNTGHDTGSYATVDSYGTSGQWDATGWAELGQQDQPDLQAPWGTDAYPVQNDQQFPLPDQAVSGYESQGYEATGYDTQGHRVEGLEEFATADTDAAHAYATNGPATDGYVTQGFDPHGFDTHGFDPQHLEADYFASQAFEATGLESSGLPGDYPDAQAYLTAPVAQPGAVEAELADYEHELADIDPHAGFDDAAYSDIAFGTTAADGAESGLPEHAHEGAAHFKDEAEYGDGSAYASDATHEDDTAQGHEAAAPVRPAPVRRSSGSSVSRTRRRTPAKRSALLTVAVPSVCVMGVAGVAAASVGGIGGDNDKQTSASAADGQAVKPSVANNKLDTQLDNLSADTRDFADRASRTQERIDLEAKREAERKRAAEEAARKERLRPKFALPVAQHGLSAYYGQAGVNWMSVHSGIDFPVAYGTQVMAATDGTVRMQYNTSYGNMAIVTAKDGTETWYCHLSSYRVSSGTTVKAGDVIAFSGNSGNSTGPHLHFEVRPGGGAAIDPLAWLRSHGLDPS